MKSMTGKQFIRDVRKLGRKTGTPVIEDRDRGKGDHVTLTYGTNSTIVGDLNREYPG